MNMIDPQKIQEAVLEAIMGEMEDYDQKGKLEPMGIKIEIEMPEEMVDKKALKKMKNPGNPGNEGSKKGSY